MGNKTFALKGNICYSKSLTEFQIMDQSWLVCEDGKCAGIFKELPEKYKGIETKDLGNKIIIPGLNDIHLHAPQYSFRALGMDMELLEWLNTHAFPQEAKYADTEYAKKAYSIFVNDLKYSATTRFSAFGTLHVEGTEVLMDLLEATNMKGYIGKVNMDRNGPDYLQEKDAKTSAEDTRRWIEDVKDKYKNIKPILTPRFTPSCTDELMGYLSEIQKEYKLPMQSHLSENLGEISWVSELCPNTSCYGEAYSQFDMFGGDCPTIMAHCVHCPDKEIEMMKEGGVFVAHCPESNSNLSSGIAPVRKYLERGLKVGLGCDIAGGTILSIFFAMAEAIRCSKLYWRLVDDSVKPLSVEEVFYLATKGGGEFFGKVGSFESDYEFDAVVLDDSMLPCPFELGTRDRLERMIYISDNRSIVGKYVAGVQIF